MEYGCPETVVNGLLAPPIKFPPLEAVHNPIWVTEIELAALPRDIAAVLLIRLALPLAVIAAHALDAIETRPAATTDVVTSDPPVPARPGSEL
jgi:hypothetical protein